MNTPPHPGLGLKEDIQALGLSIAKAAGSLGVTRQQLYRIVRGECAVTPDLAIRLEKAIGGTADIWLRMQLDHDLAKVRAHKAEKTAPMKPRPPSKAA